MCGTAQYLIPDILASMPLLLYQGMGPSMLSVRPSMSCTMLSCRLLLWCHPVLALLQAKFEKHGAAPSRSITGAPDTTLDACQMAGAGACVLGVRTIAALHIADIGYMI